MVMHARKPQRVNDGYFEKHQSHSYQSSKYSSKREYERDRSSNYRDRGDLSPGGASSLNNGNSSYRSQSPEIDSPSSRGHSGGGGGGGGVGGGGHEIRDRGDHRGGGGDRFSYMQKMRDRDRDVYKKEKYSDKRDRRGGGGGGGSGGNDRDSESHRTNHDRLDRRGGSGAKLCSSTGDKRSGSDDRDRDRERDRDLRDGKRERGSERGDRDRDRSERDRERERDRGDRGTERDRDRGGGGGAGGGSSSGGGGTSAGDRSDRGERVARCGDWSEHVSSSGKMYYYNCKTEVSQWEKPKEWIERERTLARDQHREKDYREKDRDRDREDRFSRSAYTKHSSSRGSSRLRWNYENDGGAPSHRRRLEGRLAENPETMDISPGDSTPTSEASYSLSGTPTTHGSAQHNDQSNIAPSSTVGLPNALPRLASHPNACSMSSIIANANAVHFSASSSSAGGGSGVMVGGASMLSVTGLAPVSSVTSTATAAILQSHNSNHRKPDSAVTSQQQQHTHQSGMMSPSAAFGSTNAQLEHHINSNTPGPPKLGAKSMQDQDMLLNSQQKAALIMRQQQQQQHHHHLHMSQHLVDAHGMGVAVSAGDVSNHASSVASAIPSVISLRENSLNSPLYNLTHGSHAMSPMNYIKSPLTSVASAGHTNNVTGASGPYASNTAYGLKTVESGGGSSINSMGNSICPPSACLSGSVVAGGVSGSGIIPCEGPPTPTQELDLSGTTIEQQQQQQRKLVDNTSSASLSTLQGCVSSSVQAGRSQGPEISPKLAKYFRADLITHVTNWQADILEKQAQKCSEETHFHGDLQCTKVSAELKCARSLVRITEITATLQEQKIMYLRQQIRRIEESKSQNSFMSDDL